MNKNKIKKYFKIDNIRHHSLRGDYQIVPTFRYNEFTIESLEIEFKQWLNVDNFFKLVEKEFNIFCGEQYGDLVQHPFWKNEEPHLIEGYWNLHVNFNKVISKSRHNTSRNVIATNDATCVSLLQKHLDTIYCTSRSCDISLGYLADLYTLYLYAKKLNCNKIVWTINCPHIYTNNLKKTRYCFKNKIKLRDLIFNQRSN